MCGGANFACGLYLFALGVNPARPPQKNNSATKVMALIFMLVEKARGAFTLRLATN